MAKVDRDQMGGVFVFADIETVERMAADLRNGGVIELGGKSLGRIF